MESPAVRATHITCARCGVETENSKRGAHRKYCIECKGIVRKELLERMKHDPDYKSSHVKSQQKYRKKQGKAFARGRRERSQRERDEAKLWNEVKPELIRMRNALKSSEQMIDQASWRLARRSDEIDELKTGMIAVIDNIQSLTERVGEVESKLDALPVRRKGIGGL